MTANEIKPTGHSSATRKVDGGVIYHWVAPHPASTGWYASSKAFDGDKGPFDYAYQAELAVKGISLARQSWLAGHDGMEYVTIEPAYSGASAGSSFGDPAA